MRTGVVSLPRGTGITENKVIKPKEEKIDDLLEEINKRGSVRAVVLG